MLWTIEECRQSSDRELLFVSATQTLDSLALRGHGDQSDRVGFAASLLDACIATSLLRGDDDDVDDGTAGTSGLRLRLHTDAQISECLKISPEHKILAQNLTDHLSSPSKYLKMDPHSHHVAPLMKMLMIGPNALKEARMTREHLLSPMSNLRLGIARLSRKQKNYVMAQELLIQVGKYSFSGYHFCNDPGFKSYVKVKVESGGY